MKSNRILIISSAILFFGLTLPTINSGAESPRVSNDRRDFHRKLAFFHAPILFQDTETRGQSQDEGNAASVDQPTQRRGDFIARIDFDGDWTGLNNWPNFAKRPPADKNKDETERALDHANDDRTQTEERRQTSAYP